MPVSVPFAYITKQPRTRVREKKNSSRRAQPPRPGPGKMADGSASASPPSVSPHHQYHRDAIKSSGTPSRFSPVSSRCRCLFIASNTRRARAAAVAEALTYRLPVSSRGGSVALGTRSGERAKCSTGFCYCLIWEELRLHQGWITVCSSSRQSS